jgi:hypothetical protein
LKYATNILEHAIRTENEMLDNLRYARYMAICSV